MIPVNFQVSMQEPDIFLDQDGCLRKLVQIEQ